MVFRLTGLVFRGITPHRSGIPRYSTSPGRYFLVSHIFLLRIGWYCADIPESAGILPSRRPEIKKLHPSSPQNEVVFHISYGIPPTPQNRQVFRRPAAQKSAGIPSSRSGRNKKYLLLLHAGNRVVFQVPAPARIKKD